MPNLINRMIARELAQGFRGADGMIIVSIAGLTVAETEGLRDALAEHGVRLRMVRNRLARFALRERGIEAPVELFQGNVACAWGAAESAVHAAKILQGSSLRKEGKIKFRGGLLEGNLLGPQEAAALATLPSKDELRGMLLGTLAAPAQSLVRLLVAPQASLARVLQAHADAASAAAHEAPEALEEGTAA